MDFCQVNFPKLSFFINFPIWKKYNLMCYWLLHHLSLYALSSNTFKIKRSDAKIKLFVLRSTYFLNFGKIINFLMFYLDNSKFLATKNLCWFFNIFHFSFSFLLEHTTSSIWKLNQFYFFSRFKSGWSWPKHLHQLLYIKTSS